NDSSICLKGQRLLLGLFATAQVDANQASKSPDSLLELFQTLIVQNGHASYGQIWYRGLEHGQILFGRFINFGGNQESRKINTCGLHLLLYVAQDIIGSAHILTIENGIGSA